MSVNSTSPDPATIAELQRRLDHADANPVVLLARNGDQNPITIDHAMMMPLLRSAPYQGDEWNPLRAQVQAQLGTSSGNYSGRWVRSILIAASLPVGGE